MFLDVPLVFVKYAVHLGLDEITAISRTTFSNVFSWKEMYKFQ